MGFEDLVSDDPAPSREEMERLRRLIKEYEASNVRFKEERDVTRMTYEGVLEGQEHRDKERNDLYKKINSLKMTLNIEKKASDGLTKKAGMLDIDLKLHKEERKNLIDEQISNRRKVADLERKLLDDRAKRLRNIHENDILRKRNLELDARNRICEEQARTASEDLLVKIQKLQSATELIDKHNRTISAQGAEMLELNREVTMLKEANKAMTDDYLRLERQMAACKKDRDNFEHENFRLRREMVSTANTTSQRAAAFDGFRPASKQSTQRASTSVGGSRGGSTVTYGSKPNTASAGLAASHSFQFADWEGAPASAGGGRSGGSLSPVPRRAATSEGGTRGAAGGRFSPKPIGTEMSQLTMDTDFGGGGGGGFSDTAATEFKDRDMHDPDESVDTFGASAATASTGTGTPKAASRGRIEGGGRGGKELYVETLQSPPSGLKPLIGTSPMSSPMVPYHGGGRGGAALSPVATRSGSSQGGLSQQGSSKGGSSRGGSGSGKHGDSMTGVLANRPRGKLHERGKTGFVGQGLGMVASPSPKYSSGGSAKQVLARILAES